jgi:hypothetical protein
MEPYSVVLTSCRRFDLLAVTLRSLLGHLDGPRAEVIVIEDSDRAEVADVVGAIDPAIRVIVNGTQLGQIPSIDKAYAAVTTDYVFHCEDDWEFLRTGFVAESFAILAHHADVSMVSLRAREELHPKIRNTPKTALDGLEYFLVDPRWHPERGGYSFNPGLRRMADYRAIGPFEPIGGEEDISYRFKRQGFRLAYLEVPAVRHIGEDRHIDDPRFPPRARSRGAKLRNSVRKRWKRLKRVLSSE